MSGIKRGGTTYQRISSGRRSLVTESCRPAHSERRPLLEHSQLLAGARVYTLAGYRVMFAFAALIGLFSLACMALLPRRTTGVADADLSDPTAD